jgi:sterol desaturase/sphingolipid hydroxylase (fatty acid hydroxylase superfamily)
VAALEMVMPRRPPGGALRQRWFSNLAICVLNVIAVRALMPLLAVGMAALAAERGTGLLNVIHTPLAVGWIVSPLVLDFCKYFEHRALHRFSVLWRVHRVHHTDQDFDVTVGLRFHPIEALLFACWPLGVIGLLGLPVSGVAAWHLAGLVNAAFSHANVRIPERLDRAIRLVTVTPDMHRIHHSAVAREGNSNLGNLFPWWDQLFGTYIVAPHGGLDAMPIGVAEFRDPKHLSLPWMLVHPFLRG